MSSESIHVQVSPEELRQLIQGAFAALFDRLANCRPVDQLITIDDRCKQRWPMATKRNQRRVRDVCVGMHCERLGRHPLKRTGHVNGCFVIERDHLDILDTAIDIVMEEVASRESMPLFSRRPR
jgi:hypothetical protein